jgi:hypothetical protein
MINSAAGTDIPILPPSCVIAPVLMVQESPALFVCCYELRERVR